MERYSKEYRELQTKLAEALGWTVKVATQYSGVDAAAATAVACMLVDPKGKIVSGYWHFPPETALREFADLGFFPDLYSSDFIIEILLEGLKRFDAWGALNFNHTEYSSFLFGDKTAQMFLPVHNEFCLAVINAFLKAVLDAD